MLLGQVHVVTPDRVVQHLTALQAQDDHYARWSVAQRTTSPSAAAVDTAFDDGHILRTHVLRPTWHYVTMADLSWLIRLSGPRVQRTNAPKYRQLELDAAVLNRSTDLIAAAVDGAPKTRQQLTAVLDRAGIAVAGERATYLLMHAELSGAVCSGPRHGRQQTYAAFDQRVPAGPHFDRDQALAELAWRYFSTRGPATIQDFTWWSGLTAHDTRQGLDAVRERLETHVLDDRTFWLAGPTQPQSKGRQVDLIACYDEIVVSYRHPREALRHPLAALAPLQRLKGFQHGILLDGRLVGHWRPAQDGTGSPIETRTAQPVDHSAMERAALRFRQFAAG